MGYFSSLLALEIDEYKSVIAFLPSEITLYDTYTQSYFVAMLNMIISNRLAEFNEFYKSLQHISESRNLDSKPELDLCMALFNRDNESFSKALFGYADRRVEQARQNKPMPVGEQFIFIDGLALIKLASDLGVKAEIDHPMLPIDLQSNLTLRKLFSEPHDFLINGKYIEGLQDNNYFDGWLGVKE
jgi:hypothetical protein